MAIPRRWQDLTSLEIAGLDRVSTVAVLTAAAIEQHGPHLPLSTDAVIAAGIVEQALARLPEAIPVLTLPAVEIGYSPEHADFPGTLTMPSAVLTQTLVEIGASIARAGLRKLVLFNTHGGQPGVVGIAAQELRARHAMAVVVANSWALMTPEKDFAARECAQGIHGGAVETSLMLHLAPAQVRRDRIADFRPSGELFESDYPTLARGGRLRLAWQAQDHNPAGVLGDARLATEAAGRELVDQAAAGLAARIEELSRLPLDRVIPAR